jgi:hypothetical protein
MVPSSVTYGTAESAESPNKETTPIIIPGCGIRMDPRDIFRACLVLSAGMLDIVRSLVRYCPLSAHGVAARDRLLYISRKTKNCTDVIFAAGGNPICHGRSPPCCRPRRSGTAAMRFQPWKWEQGRPRGKGVTTRASLATLSHDSPAQHRLSLTTRACLSGHANTVRTPRRA